ncbi:MAG TPA: triose-phosphate isomerase [Candidatus Doudnabacteria bacterium]|nr:triose-phosphate isomerase [Candidatus Doudnabacteria bacterium]
MNKLIVANWKLNPLTLQEAQALAGKINEVSPYEVVLCPPLAFLTHVKYLHLGAQDVSAQIKGAYTGQISASHLASVGVDYCIVGHSERRAMGERDETVNQKLQALLQFKITPILCVGYGTTVTQDELEVTDVLGSQLSADLAEVDPKKVIVAYEPVWAIGSGRPATPEHAEQIALYISTKFGVKSVLYGGSVNSTNSESFLIQHHIGGLLVGGASLLPDDFNKMIS